MWRFLLFPLILITIAGCYHSETVEREPSRTTVVTPAPAGSSTTIVRP
jgi:hypothetical protein